MPSLLLQPARSSVRLASHACRRGTASTAAGLSHPSPSPPPSPAATPPPAYQSRPFSASPSLLTRLAGGAPPPTTTATPDDAPVAESPLPPAPPSRWLADLRARVGRCLAFGCDARQVSRAAGVLGALAAEWRPLLAGSEGFLTDGRRGLDGREVAWGEMDSFGHVNNVNYYRYAETARVNWITNFAVHVDPRHRDEWRDLMSPKASGLIMRSLKADFKFPLVYPDKISVYHKLRSKPEGDPAPSSFFLDCIVLSHQHRRIACRLEEDIVVYDYVAGGKTSMPGFMLDLFDETWRLQQQETIRARNRIRELTAVVERLENETWNRPDAVEDMGSSAKGRI